MVILITGLLTIQTAPSVRAQHRMGMMMGRPMMMNGGMAQGLNANLIGNSFASRRFGFGRYGGGVYADLYAPAYSYEDHSNSKQKKRKYWHEEPTLSPEEERERLHQIELAWSQGEMNEFESQTATALNILLADLYDLQSKGLQAPDMTLDTESLGRLNVLVGRTNGNPGLLRNHGQQGLADRPATPGVSGRTRIDQLACPASHRTSSAWAGDRSRPVHGRRQETAPEFACENRRHPDAGIHSGQSILDAA